MSDQTDGQSAKIQELAARYQADPGSRVFLQLAEEYRKANRFDKAIEVCLAGLEQHPSYTTARVTLARAYLGLGERDAARAELEKVIAAVPDNLLANRHLGDLHFEDGRAAEALRRYRVVQMLDPGNDEILVRVAHLEGGAPMPPPGARPPIPAPPPAPAPLAPPMAAPKTARDLFGPARSFPDPSAPPAAADDGMGDFMDLKMDESIILNADMIKAALAGPPPGGAPARPVVAMPPPMAAAPPQLPVDDGLFGRDAGEDFSDFASPTVMLRAEDMAGIPGVASPTPAAGPAPVAVPSDLAARSARAADKFGISAPAAPAPPPAPLPPPMAAPPPVAFAPAPVHAIGDEMGGMDEFAEFGAATVMLNTDMFAEALAGPPPGSRPAAPPPVPPTPAPPWQPAPSPVAPAPAAAPAPPPWQPPPPPIPAQAPPPPAWQPAAAASPPPAAPPWQPPPPPSPAPPAWQPAPGPIAPTAAPPWAAAAAAAAAAPPPSHGPDVDSFGTSLIPIAEIERAAAMYADVIAPAAAPVAPIAVPPPAVWPTAAPVAPAADEVTGKTLGELYLQQGHFDRALEVFERYAQQHPDDREAAAKVAGLRSRAPQVAVTPPPSPVAAPTPKVSAPGETGEAEKKTKLSDWLASLKKH